nr:gamma-glutamyl-phosphate reductase [Candidatus Omnitrophota bacterium]
MANKDHITELCIKVKAASRELALIPSIVRSRAVLQMASALAKNSKAIISANAKDVSCARKAGLSAAMVDRLTLDEKRIRSMADSLAGMSRLPDPVGGI